MHATTMLDFFLCIAFCYPFRRVIRGNLMTKSFSLYVRVAVHICVYAQPYPLNLEPEMRVYQQWVA